ncbi:MAG: FtsL-like putative cell division protein [Salinivirgaceae bacterium]
MKLFGKRKIISSKNEGKMPLKNVLDGSILTKDVVIEQLPYLLFLTFVAVLYIGNRYHSEKIVRETSKTQTELKELRAESITTASKLMYISKQSEVIKLVNKKGLELEEAVEPPKKLRVAKND